MLAYGNSPMAEQVPPEWREKIVHATLTVRGNALTGADLLPKDYEPPKRFFVLLGVDDSVHAERILDSLSENGMVRMPIQETFWAIRFGVLVESIRHTLGD
jgi:PhnB protein